jgi:hypothetical protein
VLVFGAAAADRRVLTGVAHAAVRGAGIRIVALRDLRAAAEDGLVEKDYIHYMVGTDYTFSDYLINIQFIQKYIFDYENDIYEDEVQNNFSFWLQANFLNERLKPEILALYDSNEGAWLIRPKSGYELNDQLIITLGLDVFTGPSRSFFGQFDSNDRMYVEVKYSF